MVILSKSIRVALLLCAMGAVGYTQDQDRDPETWIWNNPKDLGIEGLRHVTFDSESMDRTVGFQIYLPPQYFDHEERRFPVVYFLHGAGGNESSDAGLSARVDAEIRANRIQATIYVFPNGGKRSGYRDSQETYVRSETMLMEELIPLIDREYRTLKSARSRGICGFSMGGGGAIRLALKYPEVFGAVASLAGSVDRSNETAGGDNCYVHATALTELQRERIRVYMVVGEDDFLFPRHPPFLESLKELEIAYTLVTHSEVGHNLGVLSQLSADSMIRHFDRELAVR